MMAAVADTFGAADVDDWSRASSRALHPSNRVVDLDVVSSIASGLGAVTLPWELRTGEVPTERRYERLLSTPVYDAWVICWPAGAVLGLHDHGGSAGAFTIVSGQLDETTVEHGVVVRHLHEPGDTATFGPEHVHEIANRGTQLTTSVHVYSPPLTVMDFYIDGDAGLVAARRDPGDWDVPLSWSSDQFED